MVSKVKKTAKKKEFHRPPVVAVMGHVDHGKTSLLDYIRKTNVALKESGGITQHIGAYQVKFTTEKNKNPQSITFIDTPGHEAFTKMRLRGAQVTDIVVLVIAGNDGVMPQTIESLKHIKTAKTPFIIAINKIDLPEVNIEKIKKQLVKENILVEGYGGDIIVVPVSAKTGKGVDDLLEMILLYSQMNEDKFKADPEGKLEAYIIESKLDKRCGVLATVLVKNGTLHIGQKVIVGKVEGKIRAMRNELGKNTDQVGPSMPVEILGLKDVPGVGEKLSLKSEEEEKKEEISIPAKAEEKNSEGKIRIILKADTTGSIEALIYSLPSDIEVFEKGVGEITESDVLLAKSTKSIIIGFGVMANKEVEKLAETEGILVKTYKIIYELLNEIDDVIAELTKPKNPEKTIGKAKILADFLGTSGRIAGCKILEGKISKNDTLKIKREEKVIADNLKAISMKHLKKDVDKVVMGAECGIVLNSEVDFRIGDMIVSYKT